MNWGDTEWKEGTHYSYCYSIPTPFPIYSIVKQIVSLVSYFTIGDYVQWWSNKEREFYILWQKGEKKVGTEVEDLTSAYLELTHLLGWVSDQ